MEINWGHEKEQFMSYKGIVNRGGYFSSAKQAAYFDKFVKSSSNHIGPCTAWDDSVDVAEGEYLLILEATVSGTNFAQDHLDHHRGFRGNGWGRHTRFYSLGFVFDGMGVARMYRLKRKYNSEGGSEPRGDKTTVEFQREENAQKISELSSGIAQNNKEIADRKAAIEAKKAASEYVGEVGDRIEVKGTGRLITTHEGQYGISYLYLISDSDGNTIKYFGGKYLGDKGFEVSMVATVKKHEEYGGEKQTVINRPAKIESTGLERACA